MIAKINVNCPSPLTRMRRKNFCVIWELGFKSETLTCLLCVTIKLPFRVHVIWVLVVYLGLLLSKQI